MKFFIYLFLSSAFLITNIFADKLDKFIINGNERISDQTIILFSKKELNQEIKENDLNEIIKNLYETNFFSDVSVTIKDNILTINISENPIIQSIEITGIKSSKYSDPLYELMSMKEKSSYVENHILKDLTK